MTIYLDNSATTFPKPEAVRQAVNHYLRHIEITYFYPCLAFAVLLFAGQQELERCKPLFSDGEQRQVLLELAQALG